MFVVFFHKIYSKMNIYLVILYKRTLVSIIMGDLYQFFGPSGFI